MTGASSGARCNGFTRLQLFEFLRDNKNIARANTVAVRQELVEHVCSSIPSAPEEEVRKKISLFTNNFLLRYKKCGRKLSDFTKKFEKWLSTVIILPLGEHQHTPAPAPVISTPATAAPVRLRSVMRRKKEFSTASMSTKKRRTRLLLASHSPDEVLHAVQTSLTKQGKRSTASVIRRVAFSSPKSVKIIKRLNLRKRSTHPFTPQEALAFFVNSKLTVAQYKQMHKEAKERNFNMYPCYDKLILAKKECYPKDIVISETAAIVGLQSLLDHATKRIAMVQHEVLSRVATNDTELSMKYKWGFDGSSGHSTYKQRFASDQAKAVDSDILITAVIPLQMIAKTDNQEDIVWHNPRASSTRYCLPLRIQHTKETDETIKNESTQVENQILALTPTLINIQGTNYRVSHFMVKTMIDGKVANALADNKSSQSCHICKATPNQMNDIERVQKRPCNFSTYQYGLSTLHAHIRFFECILHISYRLPTKIWRVPAEDKKAIEERKQTIIEQFRRLTGLLVDVVKQGTGNTNDGNTARRFFDDPQLAAEITNISEELIRRFRVILQVISSGYKVNSDRFRVYGLATARLFVQEYPWYKMPPAVHKILIHGADVMETLFLPIGMLSEEALEARHKDCRYYREHNTRKIGRKETMEDLLHALLTSADPVISSMRPLPQRKIRTLDKEAVGLLEVPQDPRRNYSSDSNSSDSE